MVECNHKKHSALCPTFGHYPALTYMFSQDAPLTQSRTDTSTVHVRQFPLRTTVPLIFASDPLHYVHTIVQMGKNPNDSCGISLTANNNAGRYLSQSFGRSAHIVSNTCFNIAWDFFHWTFSVRSVRNSCQLLK